jgi:hypothetical protein
MRAVQEPSPTLGCNFSNTLQALSGALGVLLVILVILPGIATRSEVEVLLHD